MRNLCLESIKKFSKFITNNKVIDITILSEIKENNLISFNKILCMDDYNQDKLLENYTINLNIFPKIIDTLGSLISRDEQIECRINAINCLKILNTMFRKDTIE